MSALEYETEAVNDVIATECAAENAPSPPANSAEISDLSADIAAESSGVAEAIPAVTGPELADGGVDQVETGSAVIPSPENKLHSEDDKKKALAALIASPSAAVVAGEDAAHYQ